MEQKAEEEPKQDDTLKDDESSDRDPEQVRKMEEDVPELEASGGDGSEGEGSQWSGTKSERDFEREQARLEDAEGVTDAGLEADIRSQLEARAQQRTGSARVSREELCEAALEEWPHGNTANFSSAVLSNAKVLKATWSLTMLFVLSSSASRA